MKTVTITKALKDCSPIFINDIVSDNSSKKYASNIKVIEVGLTGVDECIRNDEMKFDHYQSGGVKTMLYNNKAKDFVLMGAYDQSGMPRIYITCSKPDIIGYIKIQMDVEE